VAATITPILDDLTGKPLKYIGVRFDITKQKEHELALDAAQQAQQKLLADIESAKDLIETKLESKNTELHSSVVYSRQLQLNAGDTLYLFSDGMMDQFGGPVAPAKKFGKKAFRELLQQVAPLSANDQVAAMAKTFDDWKGFFNPQTDDVVVMVIKAK
jgi:serine phosphatase RsbU (regulator of sigma subunit)